MDKGPMGGVLIPQAEWQIHNSYPLKHIDPTYPLSVLIAYKVRANWIQKTELDKCPQSSKFPKCLLIVQARKCGVKGPCKRA